MLLINEQNDEKLLIDCGSDARHALAELGFSYQDIKSVYISHLHADHAGGLEWLALTTLFDDDCIKPNLFIHPLLSKSLWKNCLSGGLTTLQGVKANLKTFFNVQEIDSEGKFVWQNIEFQMLQTMHVVANFNFMPSFGLIFNVNGKNIFITNDTQYAPKQLHYFYNNADIIFQDCETSDIPSGVHAHFNELIRLNKSIKAKMWLYHYNPGPLPDAKAHGFCGFVEKGQSFEL